VPRGGRKVQTGQCLGTTLRCALVNRRRQTVRQKMGGRQPYAARLVWGVMPRHVRVYVQRAIFGSGSCLSRRKRAVFTINCHVW